MIKVKRAGNFVAKYMTVEADPKRHGMLIARYYEDSDLTKRIGCEYGKKNQKVILNEIERGEEVAA